MKQLVVLLVLLLAGCTAVSQETACTADSDCVPNKCCHPTGLVNKDFAPVCEKFTACTASCEGGLDCKQWIAKCENKVCKAIFSE